MCRRDGVTCGGLLRCVSPGLPVSSQNNMRRRLLGIELVILAARLSLRSRSVGASTSFVNPSAIICLSG